MDRNVWRLPDMVEEKCLRNYFKRQTTFGNVFFAIWIFCGIAGMIGVSISLIKEILKDPKMALSMIITGVIGEVLLYLFFFKLGSYLKTSLNAELNALNKKQLLICIVTAVDKEDHMSHTRRHGRNYYIRVNYLKGGQLVQDKIRTSPGQYSTINPGDEVFLTCYHPSFEAEYMSALAMNALMVHID